MTILFANLALLAFAATFSELRREYDESRALTIALVVVGVGVFLAGPMLVIRSIKEALMKRG